MTINPAADTTHARYIPLTNHVHYTHTLCHQCTRTIVNLFLFDWRPIFSYFSTVHPEQGISLWQPACFKSRVSDKQLSQAASADSLAHKPAPIRPVSRVRFFCTFIPGTWSIRLGFPYLISLASAIDLSFPVLSDWASGEMENQERKKVSMSYCVPFYSHMYSGDEATN